jgi:hypothetical protein
VERVPQLGDDEEILALDDALLDGAGNALTALDLIAVICVAEKNFMSASVVFFWFRTGGAYVVTPIDSM